MSLAISFAHQMLIDFCEQKGRLFYPDSDEEAKIGEPFTIRGSHAQQTACIELRDGAADFNLESLARGR
jgi:hypothetical protein